MIIIGVFTRAFSKSPFLDQETGEFGERRLNHSDGEAERFYGELKRTFALLKATLDRVQALFSIRGTRRIAPFSARMRSWRDTTAN